MTKRSGVTTNILPSGELGAPARQQLTVAGRLHALAGTGTATVTLNEDERLSVDQVVRLLEFAWQQTDVLRLRFRPRPPEEQQPSLLG